MAWLSILLASILLTSNAVAAWPPKALTCELSPIREGFAGRDETWAFSILKGNNGLDVHFPIVFDFSHILRSTVR